VISQLALLLFVYAVPAVIDLVRSDVFCRLRPVLRIFFALDAWRNQSELIPLMFGKFSSQFAGIIVAIDIDLAAFFAPEFADLTVTPVEIGAATVSAAAPVPDVGAIKGIDDERGIASAIVEATAPRIGVRTKIPNVNESISFGADIAGLVDPAADANSPFTASFRR
jgi:hypothetical protein